MGDAHYGVCYECFHSHHISQMFMLGPGGKLNVGALAKHYISEHKKSKQPRIEGEARQMSVSHWKIWKEEEERQNEFRAKVPASAQASAAAAAAAAAAGAGAGAGAGIAHEQKQKQKQKHEHERVKQLEDRAAELERQLAEAPQALTLQTTMLAAIEQQVGELRALLKLQGTRLSQAELKMQSECDNNTVLASRSSSKSSLNARRPS